ncbi:MAG: hypothetical protein QG608_1950 [Actinomycetota bacterium]|nr:hypothetical protein [Actinomycetota bacterium]
MAVEAPDEFLAAVTRLRQAGLRPEILLQEVPAPQRIAPHALALSAEVVQEEEELATGRFVLLYDPSGQDAWEGTFRAVTFVRAALEPELGSDQLLAQVGWTWLQEALQAVGAQYVAAGGTVTRVISESFGSLAGRNPSVELELRASWSPLDDPALHLQAWGQLLCTVAGLPPLPDGVAPLPHRR